MILNLDTFDLADAGANVKQFNDLLALLDAKSTGKISVGWQSMQFVASVLSACRGQAAKVLQRKYFMGWNDMALSRHTGVTVTPRSGGVALPAAYMAAATQFSEVTVGLSGSAYDDDFDYTLMPGKIESRMLTLGSHFSEGDYKRWTFLTRFKDDDAYERCFAVESSTEHKHFDLKMAKSAVCPSSQWGKAWIDRTKHGDAKFMPGLAYKSHEYYYLIYLALKKAYAHGLYSETAQDQFELDLRTPIGAAGGDVTTKIVLYCTSVNTIHIRPCEMQKQHSGVRDSLRTPYRPFVLDYDLD